jgi:hypothetical protein
VLLNVRCFHRRLRLGILDRDILASIRLQYRSYILRLINPDRFQERNELHEAVVARCTLPLGNDDAIPRVLADDVRVGVQNNDLGEVSVEVLEVLDDTVRARTSGLPEELVGDEEVVRVQLLKDG